MSEILSETILTTEQLELTAGVQRSAKFLLILINDILDFSKIESGHMDIEAIPFQPYKMIHDLHLLMELPAKERGIELICHNGLSPDMFITGDSGRLRQVLTNLLSNSIKFTSEGSVTLSIEVQPQEHSGFNPNPDFLDRTQHLEETTQNRTTNSIMLRFTVSDTGCGISDATMAKLFRPFSQADSSTARIHGGTGLGLSISRQLVELMGGRINLTSKVSVGSVATVVLPYNCFIRRGSVPDRRPTDPSSGTVGQKTAQDIDEALDGPDFGMGVAPSSVEAMQENALQQYSSTRQTPPPGASVSLPERSKALVLVVEVGSIGNTLVLDTDSLARTIP